MSQILLFTVCKQKAFVLLEFLVFFCLFIFHVFPNFIFATFKNKIYNFRDLLASSSFRDVAKDLSCEFESVSEGYDDAVDKIGKMAHSLSQVKGEWDAWNSRQNDIRNAMVRIESHLKEGQMDNKMIADEMELCQERMNSLETMCNYLTASLGSIQNESNSKNLPDFKAELSIYSNALARLKDR